MQLLTEGRPVDRPGPEGNTYGASLTFRANSPTPGSWYRLRAPGTRQQVQVGERRWPGQREGQLIKPTFAQARWNGGSGYPGL